MYGPHLHLNLPNAYTNFHLPCCQKIGFYGTVHALDQVNKPKEFVLTSILLNKEVLHKSPVDRSNF